MLKLINISKYYHSNDVVAMGLRKVHLEFKLGEFIAVTGESGSGKSTLLNVISGLDTYEDGEMYVNEEETSYYSVEDWEAFRRQYIGFVFQNYNIIDSYSVLENVMIALTIQGYDKEHRKSRALELIERVGLTSHKNHKASKLSGGEKQRCVIARALAKDCPIIVADEPTGNLDSESSKKILALLKEISEDKLVIVVTHNYNEIKDYATRKIRLFDGEVVEDKVIKKTKEVDAENDIPKFSMNILSVIGISLRNLYRTPKRTIFTTIVLMFVVAVFTFAYGGYVSGTEDSGFSTHNYYFANVNESRIVVKKYDDSYFTAEELEEIEDIRLVRTVMENDVILDLIHYGRIEHEYGSYRVKLFTNPASMLKETQLIEGELPSSKYEIVVASTDNFDVGDEISLSFSEGFRTDIYDNEIIAGEFVISGLVEQQTLNYNEGSIYFHDDYILGDDLILQSYINSNAPKIILSLLYEDETFWIQESYIDDWQGNQGTTVTIDNSLDNFEIYINTSIAQTILNEVLQEPLEDMDYVSTLDFQISTSSAYENKLIDIKISEAYFYYGTIETDLVMNQTTLNSLLDQESYQIGVLVFDSYDADRVMDKIDDMGLYTIYPDGVVDLFAAMEIFATILSLGFLLGFLMLVSYFVGYLVLKNIQYSKIKDYLIFRSIGASKKDLNRVTVFELVFTSSFAFVLTMGLLLINENYNIIMRALFEDKAYNTYIPRYLRYFDFNNYLFVFTLLVVLTLLLGRRFNRRIFGKSVITSLKQE